MTILINAIILHALYPSAHVKHLMSTGDKSFARNLPLDRWPDANRCFPLHFVIFVLLALWLSVLKHPCRSFGVVKDAS